MANITAAMVKELREMTAAAMMDCKKALNECDGDMDAAKEFLRKKGQATADKKSSRETNEGSIATTIGGGKAAILKVACETDFVAINDQFRDFLQDLAEQALEVGGDDFMEQTSSKGSIKEQFTAAISKMGENMQILESATWADEGNQTTSTYIHSNRKIGVLVQLDSDSSVDKEKLAEVAKDVAMHIAANKVEAISDADLDPEVVEKERVFLTEQARESGKPEEIIGKMIQGRLQKFKKEICLLDQPFVKQPDQTISQLLGEAGKNLGGKLTVTKYHKASF